MTAEFIIGVQMIGGLWEIIGSATEWLWTLFQFREWRTGDNRRRDRLKTKRNSRGKSK